MSQENFKNSTSVMADSKTMPNVLLGNEDGAAAVFCRRDLKYPNSYTDKLSKELTLLLLVPK
jgi:hypothetical protein